MRPFQCKEQTLEQFITKPQYLTPFTYWDGGFAACNKVRVDPIYVLCIQRNLSSELRLSWIKV